jgi:RNA-binding protein 26
LCFLSEQVAAVREHFAVFGELSSVEVEDVDGHKMGLGQPLNMNNPIRVSYTTRRSAERAMTQGRWFHGQSLNLAWVSTASTNRSSESSVPSNKSAMADHEINSRVDANEVTEELSVEEQHHIESKANVTDEALQSPNQVM